MRGTYIFKDSQSQYYGQFPSSSVCVPLAVFNAWIFYQSAGKIAPAFIERGERFKEEVLTEDGPYSVDSWLLGKIGLVGFRFLPSYENVIKQLSKTRCVLANSTVGDRHAYLITGVDDDKNLIVVNYNVEEPVVNKIRWEDLRFDYLYESHDKSDCAASPTFCQFIAIVPFSALEIEFFCELEVYDWELKKAVRREERSSQSLARILDERISNGHCLAYRKVAGFGRKGMCKKHADKDSLYCRYHRDSFVSKELQDRERFLAFVKKDKRQFKRLCRKAVKEVDRE